MPFEARVRGHQFCARDLRAERRLGSPSTPARAARVERRVLVGGACPRPALTAPGPSLPDQHLCVVCWRRRRESNPCPGFCRPLPEPLGYAAGDDEASGRPGRTCLPSESAFTKRPQAPKNQDAARSIGSGRHAHRSLANVRRHGRRQRPRLRRCPRGTVAMLSDRMAQARRRWCGSSPAPDPDRARCACSASTRM